MFKKIKYGIENFIIKLKIERKMAMGRKVGRKRV